MKKIFIALVALCATLSMQAQTIEIYEEGGTTPIATYSDGAKKYKAVFKETAFGTGTAMRTDVISVKWVQLWKEGPKFAEYNVGITDGKAESYGGHYTWDANDTATKLWGSNWRMPTSDELGALLTNCTCEWTTQNGVSGLLCTGKNTYSSNSIFLPAAGYLYGGEVYSQGSSGSYWSSTPSGTCADYLNINSTPPYVGSSLQTQGYSVRAVLNEK